MTGPAKILAVDDEPDFEALIRQRFRRRIPTKDLEFSFARMGGSTGAGGRGQPDLPGWKRWLGFITSWVTGER